MVVIPQVRAELKTLIAAWTKTGYKYTGSVYREIAMINSNYGGMENVGNTTIISSRITADHHQTDGGYMYMEGVKVHEYYHNLVRQEPAVLWDWIVLVLFLVSYFFWLRRWC